MPGKGKAPVDHEFSMLNQIRDKDSRYYRKDGLEFLTRKMREADIDVALMNRWARNGFVSVPGNMGPVDGDQREDD